MKNFKKIMAMIIAMVMIVGTMSVSALAAPGDLSVNGELKITGLDKGDTVTYYQILKWDPDNSIEDVDGNPIGWVWGDDIKSESTLTDNDLLKIVGTTDGSGEIDSKLAGKIAANVEDGIATAKLEGTEWTQSVEDAGLYMAIVDPATAGTIYNPIFVAANWYGAGEGPDTSNEFGVIPNSKSYSDNSMAKKTTIPLDKTAKGKDKADGVTNNTLADGAYTTDVGEEIDFEVATHVPKYADNYKDPVFSLTDTLQGLALTGDNVKVYIAVEGKATKELNSSYYTITGSAANATTYTVSFNKEYMQGDDIPVNGQDVIIKYTAKVTDAAVKVVNQDKNTVDLKFSTNPDDTTGAGLLRDQTNHFTFSIDANLLGHDEIGGSSTEAIKVGIDAEGNYIVEESSYAWSNSTHGPLAGAQFKLYKDSACSQLYTNDVFNGSVTSDTTGRLTIKGLDAGKYYLKEEKAPEGYIKMQEAVEVVITADIEEEKDVVEEVNNNGETVEVTYITNKLNGYTVTIGGETTTYTIENSKVTAESANRIAPSSDKELANTKGVELPSTGGIGTTIFYIIGAILVIGAGIVLVTRRRMSAN